MPTPDETIAENLANPKRVQVGNHSVDGQPLQDQIAAAEYLANQASKVSTKVPLRVSIIKPGGAV